MEKLSENQNKILHIIDTERFENLTKSQLDLCLQEYTLSELKILFQVKEAEQQYTQEIKPLALGVQKDNSNKIFTLFHAVAGIAATIIICWFAFHQPNKEPEVVTEYDVIKDTVYQEKKIVDTVYKFEEKIVYRTQLVSVTENNNDIKIDVTDNHPIQKLDLKSIDTENKGSSYQNDLTSILVQPK